MVTHLLVLRLIPFLRDVPNRIMNYLIVNCSKFISRTFSSIKAPSTSVISVRTQTGNASKRELENGEDIQNRNKVDSDTIALLEKLSLVDCMNEREIETLESAIDFADQIFDIDATNVEPLISVFEDFPLVVREDGVTEGNSKEAVLRNASITEEDYFVAPPGNIPLDPGEASFHETGRKGKSN